MATEYLFLMIAIFQIGIIFGLQIPKLLRWRYNKKC